MSTSARLIAGAMSGTSADGVDVAIVAIDGIGLQMQPKLIEHHHHPYDPAIRQRLFSARQSGQIALSDLAKLGREISQVYAKAILGCLEAAKLRTSDLLAIAAHGQTLYHSPPDTIQWIDPSLIAAATDCQVISDFRRADCAAGGQGAPLVPFADYILFRHPEKNRVLLNIGGIANITWLKAGGSIDDVIAFDTGPGNCVSDHICRKRGANAIAYDSGGMLALRGKANLNVARVAATSDFVLRSPPKSTDGPEMIALYDKARTTAQFSGSLEDELATACAMTAHTILQAIVLGCNDWWRSEVHELVVSGGGIHNTCMMGHLHSYLRERSISITVLDGTLSQAKEALAFALLGAATLDGVPSNVPSVTGAKRPVILGSVTPIPSPTGRGSG